MATTNGLPTLQISFQKAAETVANRSKKGYAAVIVRDANAQGVYKLVSPSLIPSNLGEANKKHILTAFEGSDRGAPSLVYLLVIGTDKDDTTELDAGLKKIESYSIDYLAGPPDITTDEEAAMVTWVKAQRDLYRTVKLVKPFNTTGSDNMGIIELDETGMTDAAGAVTAASYCARIAGILAGIPQSMSATAVKLPELLTVTDRTTQEQIDAINAGKLILVHDGITAKISRAVNSLTTIPTDGKADWSKIKIVEGMDLIRFYLRTTIENEYIGRYANTYSNKQLLVTEILEYFAYLESSGVLNPGESFAEVDYERQLQWLKAQGVETAGMTRQQILEYQTGSWVFIRCGGRIVDACEDFEILFNNL